MAGEGALFLADDLPEIPNSWQWGRLGDLVDQSRGICYGIVQPGDHDTAGVPMVNSQNVLDGSVSTHIEFRVSKELHARYKRSTIRGGEILLTLVGANFGRVAIAPPAFAGFNCARPVGIIPVCEHPQFVMFCLRSPLTRQFMDNWANTTAQPTLNLKEVANLPIPLPPLAEQKAIAAVLGALDDKIELNRRMNATLEAMARALFQSWFVDFDPVRAKLDGRPPIGMGSTTAALFPGSFDETELGHIPHGWTAGNFGEIISTERERIGASDAVVLSAVASSQLVRSDEHFNKQVYSKSISNYLKVRRWDFAYNPSRINIGSIGMLKESVVGAVSPVYEVFRPKAEYHWFVERSLAQPDTKVWIQTLCSGSVRQSLKLRDLESIPLVVPPPPIVQAFNNVWEQWHELIQANERESRTLATLRDTLLPKLLSGELSVENLQN